MADSVVDTALLRSIGWLCIQSYTPTNQTAEGAGQCQRLIIGKIVQNQSKLHLFTLPVILFAVQIVAVY